MKYQLPGNTPVTWVGDNRIRVGGVIKSIILPDCKFSHKLISEARRGITPQALLKFASKYPHSPRKNAAIEASEQLLSMCVPQPEKTNQQTNLVVRASKSCQRLGRIISGELSRLGHAVLLGDAELEPAHETQLVVEVTDRVLTPRRYIPLMARDMPHLIVARDDDGLLVGPLVIPGQTPCMRCNDLGLLSRDLAWVATATQFAALPAPRPPQDLECLAALTATTSIRSFLRSGQTTPGECLSFIRECLTASKRERIPVQFHDECGCLAHQQTATLP